MIDVEQMLERQARWQKSRQALTWAEKIRMAERVRESVIQLREQPQHGLPAPLVVTPPGTPSS